MDKKKKEFTDECRGVDVACGLGGLLGGGPRGGPVGGPNG